MKLMKKSNKSILYEGYSNSSSHYHITSSHSISSPIQTLPPKEKKEENHKFSNHFIKKMMIFT